MNMHGKHSGQRLTLRTVKVTNYSYHTHSSLARRVLLSLPVSANFSIFGKSKNLTEAMNLTMWVYFVEMLRPTAQRLLTEACV